MKTFAYPPGFAASVKRSRLVETSIVALLVAGLGAAFVWKAFENLNDSVGVFAIVVTVAMVGVVLVKSRRTFASLSAQAATSLTLDGPRLTQHDAAGHDLGLIDLAADFERSSKGHSPPRLVMTLRQRDQTIEFNSSIERRRELVAAILAKQFGIPSAAADDDEVEDDDDEDESPLTLRFTYRPETNAELSRSMSRARVGCGVFGAFFFGLLAYAFFRDGQPVPGTLVVVTGVVAMGFLLRGLRDTGETGLQRSNHITFQSPSLLHSRDQAGAPLGTIDLDRPFEFKYRNTLFRLTQGEQTVEFETDLDGAEVLVTWIIGRPFRDPSG